MTELEQFLLTTIVARTLFALRKALKCCETVDQLESEIRGALGNDDPLGVTGMRSLSDRLVAALGSGMLPYRDAERVVPLMHYPS